MPDINLTQPENNSLLQTTSFQLSFARLPTLVYQVQTANIPGVNTDDILRPTPFLDLHVPGNKLTYDPLNIQFLVDEDLRSWTEIYTWMTGLTKPDDFAQYRQMLRDKKDLGGQYSDAVLTINTNTNNPNIRIKFKDCFPISLSQLNLDTTQNANSPMVSDASFRFNNYHIERINNS